MKHLVGFVCVLLILSPTRWLAAQDPTQVQAGDKAQIEARIRAQEASQPTSQATSEPTLKENPLETLRKFEPGPDEEYQLGKGDEITVNFAGRPEMQAKLIVGPDGRITIPLAGDLMLAGRTRPEAAKAIETALANY
jgi:protein involved in polysaccharide export with SLBB domain